jgi:hypothetical protein
VQAALEVPVVQVEQQQVVLVACQVLVHLLVSEV